MPSIEYHIRRSVEKTGKPYREMHEWLDDKRLPYKERLSRHNIFKVKRNMKIVESMFGEDAAKEFLRHLMYDYRRELPLKLLMKPAGWLKRKL